MRVLIIDNGTSYLEQLKKLFFGNIVNIVDYSQISKIKYGDADLIVLSGGHGLPVMDIKNPYAEEIEFVKNSPVPILGICLGYELIARAFGADLKLMKKREKGILDILSVEDNQIFKNIPIFSAYESHRWVVDKLPKNLIGLAKSKDGYEVIKHKQRLIYGFQFHPEILIKQASGDNIFKNFLGIIKTWKRKR